MSGNPSFSETSLCSCWTDEKVTQIKNSKDSDDLCVIINDDEPLWKLLNEQRGQRELCDVTLTVGDRHLYAHKAVLMENIPYFKAMFESGMKETESDQIEIKDIDFECLKMVIDYVYGQEIKLTAEFFLGLVLAADFYQLPNLAKKCLIAFPQVFTEDFDVGQLLSVHSFCQLIKETNYIGPIEDAMMYNFEAVSMHPNFLKLPFGTILKFCDADMLTVKDEMVVLQAICRWLNENLDLDSSNMRDLLACARLPLLKVSTLMSLAYSNNHQFYEIIQRLANHAIEVKGKIFLLSYTNALASVFQTATREPIGTTIIFPSFGGSKWTNDVVIRNLGDSKLKNDVVLYSISDGLWKETHFLPEVPYTKVVSISGEQVCWYDRDTHNFVYRSFTSSLLKVHQKTINHSLARFDRFAEEENAPKAISNGNSWIFGNVRKGILTLWKDNSRVGTRIEEIKRGAVLVYLNEAVYIIGGISKGPAKKAVRDVLMVKDAEISVEEQVQPVPVSPMIHARESPSAVAFKGKIYVCGGKGSGGFQSTAEVYDPQKNEWKLFPYPRRKDVAVLFATKFNLYAQMQSLLYPGIEDFTLSFERFDEVEEMWKQVFFCRD